MKDKYENKLEEQIDWLTERESVEYAKELADLCSTLLARANMIKTKISNEKMLGKHPLTRKESKEWAAGEIVSDVTISGFGAFKEVSTAQARVDALADMMQYIDWYMYTEGQDNLQIKFEIKETISTISKNLKKEKV
tara:strand:- start:492 stop:902 length:411 start_codon:yes stop_codon:yes gene_type:complete